MGKGEGRECYIHPHDDKLCIKIFNDKETHNEQIYYKHLKNRGVSQAMLAKSYGSVKTNFGLGGVFDLIRDYNGSISKSLSYYISSEQKITSHFASLLKALLELKRYLLKERIIVRDLKADNVVYKKNTYSTGQLMLIDGIGNADFIPIANYLHFLAKKKILRKWQKFSTRLLANYPDNKILQQTLIDIKY